MCSLGTCSSVLSMFRPSKSQFIRGNTNKKEEEKKRPNICRMRQLIELSFFLLPQSQRKAICMRLKDDVSVGTVCR